MKTGVLMVTGVYYPELSGAGLQCRALVQALQDTVRFTVLTTTNDPAAQVAGEQDGVPVFRVFVDPARLWSKARAALSMTRVLVRERQRFSIIHLHGFSEKSILVIAVGLALRKRIAIKLTSVGHDDPVSMQRRGWLARWAYAKADAFFGVSPRFKSLYDASPLPRGRFLLMPNGVDVSRFRPASSDEQRNLRRALALPVEATVILFVGFFSREKCPDAAFEAFARLAADGDGTSALVLVGATRSTYYEVDNQLAHDIRSRASALGLEHRLHFIEMTRDIEQYQRAADIFVMPSVREGQPNALLEAMACGTACIATRLEGVTDVLIDDGESGILVPPGDVTALSTALTRLVSDPLQARAMGERARERVTRDFAMTAAAERYLAAYHALGAR